MQLALVAVVAFAGLIAAIPAKEDENRFEMAIRAKREWLWCNPPKQCVRGKTGCTISDTCNKDCIKASTSSTPYVSGYCCTAGINHCYCCYAAS